MAEPTPEENKELLGLSKAIRLVEEHYNGLTSSFLGDSALTSTLKLLGKLKSLKKKLEKGN